MNIPLSRCHLPLPGGAVSTGVPYRPHGMQFSCVSGAVIQTLAVDALSTACNQASKPFLCSCCCCNNLNVSTRQHRFMPVPVQPTLPDPPAIGCMGLTATTSVAQLSSPLQVLSAIPAGAAFYGPDGVYPFAGKECAYAFAKVSTEVEDCHSNLEDLSKAEEETLLEWEGGRSEPPPGPPLLANLQPISSCLPTYCS